MKIYRDGNLDDLLKSDFNDSLSEPMINRFKYSLVKARNGDFIKSLKLLENKTIAVSYSGGLIPDIKVYLNYIARYIFSSTEMTRILLFTNGYVGLINNSFTEITRKDFEDNPEKINNISTCRNCNPAAHRDTIIETLIRNRVDYWLIIGGDGTLRSINELIEGIENSHKLNTGFLFVPSTIDGMHMTENILGQESSERSMTELIKNLNENSWNTLDYELNVKSSGRISIYELPGRDHNYLIMNIVDRLCRENYAENNSSQFLIVLSDKRWKLADLITRISGTDKKISLLIAEGAAEPEDYSRYSSAPFTIEGLKKIIGVPSNFHRFDKIGQVGLPSEIYSVDTHLQASEWARQTILLMASMSRNRNALALTCSKGAFAPMEISELEYYNNGRNEEYHKLKQEFIEKKVREYADTDYIIL